MLQHEHMSRTSIVAVPISPCSQPAALLPAQICRIGVDESWVALASLPDFCDVVWAAQEDDEDAASSASPE